MSPFPSEHSCRIASPSKFQKDSFRRSTLGRGIIAIMARPIGSTKIKIQSLRYPKSKWSADEARAHCAKHKGSFEAASEG